MHAGWVGMAWGLNDFLKNLKPPEKLIRRKMQMIVSHRVYIWNVYHLSDPSFDVLKLSIAIYAYAP